MAAPPSCALNLSGGVALLVFSGVVLGFEMQRGCHGGGASNIVICGLACFGFSLLLPADDLKGLKLIPEDVSLFDESLAWDTAFGVRTGVGYKDNVLLSHLDRQGSPFVASGLDVSIIRLPFDGLQFYFFFTGDDSRYWHDVGVDREDTTVAEAQVQKEIGNDLKLGVAFQHAYQDQVVDVSTIESGLSTARVQGQTFILRPFLRNEFALNYWWQFELPVTRQLLKAPLDNYWQYGAKVSVGREYGHQSELTLSYAASELLYDTRFQFDADGMEVLGAPLALSQYKVELGSQHYWDATRHWRTAAKLGFDYNQDNGSGYFSYFKYEVSAQVRYQSPACELRGKLGVAHYDFPVQTIDSASVTNLTGLPKFAKTSLLLNLRAEMKVTKVLRLFAEYEHEVSLSNEPFDRYRVNTVNGGLDWRF